jgi:hypothetical protein
LVANGVGGANKLFYYVDVNDNGTCDINNVDIFRMDSLTADTIGKSVGYFSGFANNNAGDDYFD